MAELFCREIDRGPPSRVRRPYRRIGRATPAASPKILYELLQHRENAPLIGQGCATHASNSADRTHRVTCPDRRAASPICSNLSFRHIQAVLKTDMRALDQNDVVRLLRSDVTPA